MLGGGPVGAELAQAWATLGSEVVLLEGGHRILPREESFASAAVQDGLAAHGVDVCCDAEVTRVRREDGSVHVALADGTGHEGDELLVAVGRRPRTAGIGLESVGLTRGGAGRRRRAPARPRAQVAVRDRRLQRPCAADARGQVPGACRRRSICSATSASRLATEDGRLAPRVVFTEPQVAAVGHTQATAAGRRHPRAHRRRRSRTRPPGRASSAAGSPAHARLVIDADRDVVVGATFTGAEIEPLLHAATVAVVGEVPLARLRDAVPCFPTRNEVWLGLMDAANG